MFGKDLIFQERVQDLRGIVRNGKCTDFSFSQLNVDQDFDHIVFRKDTFRGRILATGSKEEKKN
jgi:hypothetical protein